MKYALIPLRAAIDSNAMSRLLLLDLVNVIQRTQHRCCVCARPGLTQSVCCVCAYVLFWAHMCTWPLRSDARAVEGSLLADVSARRWSWITAARQPPVLAGLPPRLLKGVISLLSWGRLSCFSSAVTEMLRRGMAVLQQKWLPLQQRVAPRRS